MEVGDPGKLTRMSIASLNDLHVRIMYKVRFGQRKMPEYWYMVELLEAPSVAETHHVYYAGDKLVVSEDQLKKWGE